MAGSAFDVQMQKAGYRPVGQPVTPPEAPAGGAAVATASAMPTAEAAREGTAKVVAKAAESELEALTRRRAELTADLERVAATFPEIQDAIVEGRKTAADLTAARAEHQSIEETLARLDGRIADARTRKEEADAEQTVKNNEEAARRKRIEEISEEKIALAAQHARLYRELAAELEAKVPLIVATNARFRILAREASSLGMGGAMTLENLRPPELGTYQYALGSAVEGYMNALSLPSKVSPFKR